MRKPRPMKEWSGAINPLAEAGFEEVAEDDPLRVVWINGGHGILLPELKRLRAWLDRAIAWMEAD